MHKKIIPTRITPHEFFLFESLRKSGKCNMFDIGCVQEKTGLKEYEIKEIIKNYHKYVIDFISQ